MMPQPLRVGTRLLGTRIVGGRTGHGAIGGADGAFEAVIKTDVFQINHGVLFSPQPISKWAMIRFAAI